MGKILRPGFIIPAVFGLSLLAVLMVVTNVRKVLAAISAFPPLYLLYFLLAMAAYEAVRCVQWHGLLAALHLSVPLRTQVFSFAAGEVTKNMPLGNFFQNYLLQRATGADFGFSSSATMLIVLIQVAVALAGLVILGIGQWRWLRPLIICGLAAFALALRSFAVLRRSRHVPRAVSAQPWLRYIVEEYDQFRHGAAALLHARVVGAASLLGAVYMLLGAAALYLVVRGLGLGSVTFGQAVAVYLFSLVVGLIVPIPIDVGTLEAGGVVAFVAMGVGPSDAVAVMLINRVLTVGAASALAVLAIVALPGEVRAVIHGPEPAPTACSSPRVAHR